MSVWMQAFEENDWHFASVFESRSELGHDIAHLLEPRRPADTQADPAAMTQAAAAEAEQADKTGMFLDPFPEPRTMPDHWDMTEFL